MKRYLAVLSVLWAGSAFASIVTSYDLVNSSVTPRVLNGNEYGFECKTKIDLVDQDEATLVVSKDFVSLWFAFYNVNQGRQCFKDYSTSSPLGGWICKTATSDGDDLVLEVCESSASKCTKAQKTYSVKRAGDTATIEFASVDGLYAAESATCSYRRH